MIQVKRLNGKEFYVNPHLIEMLEETPDTVITLLGGTKVVVTENAEEIVQRIIQYRSRIGEVGREPLPPVNSQGGEE